MCVDTKIKNACILSLKLKEEMDMTEASMGTTSKSDPKVKGVKPTSVSIPKSMLLATKASCSSDSSSSSSSSESEDEQPEVKTSPRKTSPKKEVEKPSVKTPASKKKAKSSSSLSSPSSLSSSESSVEGRGSKKGVSKGASKPKPSGPTLAKGNEGNASGSKMGRAFGGHPQHSLIGPAQVCPILTIQ